MIKIYESFKRAPLWVQLWMSFWLIPVNLFSLFFWDNEQGLIIASLAISGMLLNFPIMLYYKGMSKLMALPHILLWTPLIAVCIAVLSQGGVSTNYNIFLWVLVATNIISLVFDYLEFFKWVQGDRGIL